MVAILQDLFIEQGAMFEFEFQWTRGETVETAVPVNLTGYTTRMQIRKSQGTEVLVQADNTNGRLTISGDPIDGKVKLKLPGSATNLLTSKLCKYDIELINAAGDIFRVLKGTVTVDPNITQDEEDPDVI